MRLKIKPVHPSPGVQNQDNNGDQDVLKTEITEDEQANGCGWLIPEENNKNKFNSDDNDNNLDSSPTAPSVPQSLGKRKRKPKEFIDEISPIIIRRKKKKPAGHKPEDDCGGRSVSKPKKAVRNVSDHLAQLKSPTMIRAEELLSSLRHEYPSFVKLLVRSHVGSCFWMGLPVPFCRSNLPRKDTTVILENENGEQFEIKYIAEKTGLSAGWRKFVSAHKLVEGDVLIFQLIGLTTFKVDIIRANDLTEVDGALSLLNLETLTKQNDTANNVVEGSTSHNNQKKRRPISLPLTAVQKKKQKATMPGSVVPHFGQLEEDSGNNSDEVASEVLESSKSSGDVVSFKDIKSFDDFRILVNGVCIDSELPEHIRRKYYELCSSKNTFVHDRFLPGLHCKLAAGMILEAVNTVEAIRACKLSTSHKEFEKWEKSLRSFELLGMNVGFLRARLHRLQSLALVAEGALETKRYWEVKTLLSRTKGEIRNLEAKVAELKELAKKYEANVEMLKPKAESHELMFQQEVNAPW